VDGCLRQPGFHMAAYGSLAAELPHAAISEARFRFRGLRCGFAPRTQLALVLTGGERDQRWAPPWTSHHWSLPTAACTCSDGSCGAGYSFCAAYGSPPICRCCCVCTRAHDTGRPPAHPNAPSSLRPSRVLSPYPVLRPPAARHEPQRAS